MFSSPFSLALMASVLAAIPPPSESYGQRVKGSFNTVTVQKCDRILKAVKMMVHGTQTSSSFNEPSVITDVVIVLPDNCFTGRNRRYWQDQSTHQLLTFISYQNCSRFLSPNWTRRSGYGQALLFISCEENQTVTVLEKSGGRNTLGGYIVLITNQRQFLSFYVNLNSTSGLNRLIIVEVTELKGISIYQLHRPRTEWRQDLIASFFYTNTSTHSDHESSEMPSFTIKLFSERSLSNFHKESLRVAGVMDPTYAYDTNIILGQDGSYEFRDSFAVQVLKALEYTMNFTTVPRVTVAWGHLDSNGTWQGMIALLLSGEADLAMSSTADRAFRRQVIDFNMPTNEIRLSAFFRRPNSVSTSSALLDPFQSEFWLGILAWLILASLSLIVIKAELLNGVGLDEEAESPLWSTMDCFQWALSTVCLQGFYNIPSQTPFRILVAVGSFAGVLIYGAYAGTLISFLSVVVEPINSLAQLVATDYVFSVAEEPLALKFLAESPSEHDNAIYNRRRKEPAFKTMQEAKNSLNKGSFVFLVDHMSGFDSLNQDFTNDQACRMREMVVPNGEQRQGSMVNKNSTIKRLIDYQILRMFEYGLIRRWTKVYLQLKPDCDTPRVYEGVGLESVYVALLCLCSMVVLAFSIFGIEAIVGRKELTFNVHVPRSNQKLIPCIWNTRLTVEKETMCGINNI